MPPVFDNLYIIEVRRKLPAKILEKRRWVKFASNENFSLLEIETSWVLFHQVYTYKFGTIKSEYFNKTESQHSTPQKLIYIYILDIINCYR